MTTDVKSSPGAATNALVPMQPVTYELTEFPPDKFNQLVPTTAIRVPTDLVVPVVQIVRLSIDERDKDTYTSNDIPEGHRAPTARGLNKLATAASISFYDERRVDDGTDPDVMGVAVMARMLLPTGMPVTAPGSKWVNIKTRSFASNAHRDRFRRDFYEQVSTRARNRAIRAILSLKQAYTVAELAKPFAVVSFAPNMNHPLVQQLFLEQMAPAIASGFGPDGTAPRRLGAGEPQLLPEAADDDVIEGQSRPADAQPAAAATPDWADVLGGPAADPAKEAEGVLIASLRKKADGSDLEGHASDAQKVEVAQKLLTPLSEGIGPERGSALFRAGVHATWGLEAQGGRVSLSAAQAYALIEASRHDDLVELWRSAFGGKAAA